MKDQPDFEALRNERNAATERIVRDICIERGWDEKKVELYSFDPNACYCNCPKGPCEHDWQGWREFADGSGGERVCTRCGKGAMSHSLRTGE